MYDEEHLRHRIFQIIRHQVDKGMERTVYALRLFNVHTVFACYGHTTHGTGAPYVDVQSMKVAELKDRLDMLRSWNKERDSISAEIMFENLREQRRLSNLINTFYKFRWIFGSDEDALRLRVISVEDRLIVRPKGLETIRIESRGARAMGIITSDKVKEERAMRYRREMGAFTTFLRRIHYMKGKKCGV